ncbi:type II secretion system minor pseudopilin GspK [Neptuniibacter sp. QD34_54]|uniref:type II secretion system minor pseudopilin GspK n=1 Tax=Neptuniibacter sp. QD34_54 TaxID=3398208 RepID=UPI0039F58F1B
MNSYLRASVKRVDRQSGAALILVLIVASLVSITAVAVSEQTQLGIYLTQNFNNSVQANRYLSAAEQRVLLLLKPLTTEPTVNLQQAWAQPSSFPVDRGGIQISITDMRSCFNLNLIADQVEERAGKGLESEEVSRLRNLLDLDEVNLTDQRKLIEQIKDWVDPNSAVSGPYGKEDQSGIGQVVADAPLMGMDDLLLLDISADAKSKITGSTCVLPIGSGNKINVNTLQNPNVLAAYSLGIVDKSTAESILLQRPEEGYLSLDDFFSQFAEEDRAKITAMPFGLQSNFFKADLKVSYGRSVKQRRIFIRLDSRQAKIYKRVNKDG